MSVMFRGRESGRDRYGINSPGIVVALALGVLLPAACSNSETLTLTGEPLAICRPTESPIVTNLRVEF